MRYSLLYVLCCTQIERLFLSGVDVFRLNLSHGLLHEKHQQLQHVRRVERKYGHPIAVLADLPGPKLRLGSFEGNDAVCLPQGATFIIDNATSVLGNQHRAALSQHTEVLQALQAGDVLLLDDGRLKMQVRRKLDCSREAYEQLLHQRTGQRPQQERQKTDRGEQQQDDQHQGPKEDTCLQLGQPQGSQPERVSENTASTSSFPERIVGVECVVSVGGPLSGKKGVNIPAAALPLSALSARDRELARLVAGWGVDWIALSFVQRAEDVRDLRKELQAQVALLAKDASGACDSSSTTNSSSRILSGSTSSEAAVLHASTGEEGEQSVSGKKQGVQRPLKQKLGEQQENQCEATEVEQQRRQLRDSVGLHKGEGFAAFAPAHLQRGGEIAVLVKIEKPVALENIEEILEEADGLMVARGDLGVELAEHAAWLPVVQKRLVKLCQEAGKPVVIATQMLDSMTHAPAPTRAELTDVANAVYDGADAVMLSGETAAGAAPAHVAKTQLEGIQAVEADPLFWRLQNATRRLLLDKEVARAASRCTAGTRPSSSQASTPIKTNSSGVSKVSAAAHGNDWESYGPAEEDRGEQGVAAAGAAAAARDAAVSAPGNIRAGAGAVAGGGLTPYHAGTDREKLGREKEEQTGQDIHEQALAVSGDEPEQFFPLDSNLRGHRTRQRHLFPELRGGRLPWKKQVGGHKWKESGAAACRAAAVAAASFDGGECWVGSSHSNRRHRRGRSSRIGADLHAAQSTEVSAANKEDFGESADAGWVAAAAEQASRLSGATGIVIFEETGDIARRVAALRPVVPVVAVTPSAYVARELQLHWGVYPVVDATGWEATKYTVDKKGETTGEGGWEAASNKEGTSERVDGAEAGNAYTSTRTRTENPSETPQEELGKETEGITMQMRQKSWRDAVPSFGTQMSKAAALLVGEGMADANGDENVVVVGGFYTRKRQEAETSGRQQEAVNFLPHVGVCRIKAFL